MGSGNREKILTASVELFNRSGTVAVTTNHIAKHLEISPGNLYFHFRNKEEIVRELFLRLCDGVYETWSPRARLDPRVFIESSFEVFWSYRFFHREMYHLRRQDPALSRMWKRHLNRCFVLLKINYRQWVEAGVLREISDPWEMRALSESLLLTSSAYLGFFESPERPAAKKAIKAGIDHVEHLLSSYYTS